MEDEPSNNEKLRTSYTRELYSIVKILSIKKVIRHNFLEHTMSDVMSDRDKFLQAMRNFLMQNHTETMQHTSHLQEIDKRLCRLETIVGTQQEHMRRLADTLNKLVLATQGDED